MPNVQSSVQVDFSVIVLGLSEIMPGFVCSHSVKCRLLTSWYALLELVYDQTNEQFNIHSLFPELFGELSVLKDAHGYLILIQLWIISKPHLPSIVSALALENYNRRAVRRSIVASPTFSYLYDARNRKRGQNVVLGGRRCSTLPLFSSYFL